jgi:hypothetical protein
MLPVSSEVLISELALAEKIIAKWKSKVEEGIPGVDLVANEDALASFVMELCGELSLVSGKCETLAAVLSEGMR